MLSWPGVLRLAGAAVPLSYPAEALAQSFLDRLAQSTLETLADRAASIAVDGSAADGRRATQAPVRPGGRESDIQRPRPRTGAPARISPPSRTPGALSGRLATDRFAPQNVLSFWRSHGPLAVTSQDPSELAPGFISDRPLLHVHQPRSGRRITPAEIEALRVPLEAAFQALIAQPSIAQIRGASLTADINISVKPTHDGEHLVVGILTLRARKILLDSPSTVVTGGRHHTPDLEGDTLDVILNPYELIANRDVQTMAQAGTVMYARAGRQMILLVSDEPEPPGWTARRAADALARDRSWYSSGPGAHPMAITVRGPSHTGQELVSGRLDPAAPMARLAAAAFMVDWAALHSTVIGRPA